MDDVDRRLVLALAASPRTSVLELSRVLGVARATVQARLDRLRASGVVTGFGPQLDLPALGYTVLAFTTLEIAQGRGPEVLGHLRTIAEVIEVHATTGSNDLLCRVVARSNEHLYRVLDHLAMTPGIVRTTSSLALANPIPHRVLQLLT